MKSIALCVLCLLTYSATAQPKWAKKYKKSLVEIVTHDKDGLVLQRRAGFIVGDDGRVLTTYDQLPSASNVEIVASDGKSYLPVRVIAADAMMDYVLFTTDVKKPVPLPISTVSSVQGDAVYILASAACVADTIKGIETIKEQPYYSVATGNSNIGAPLLNVEGELLGMVHATDETGAYAVSMGTIANAKPTAITAVNRTYSELPIPVLLPEGEDQARTFVFLASKADSARYMAHVNDFIELYPTASFGYATKGEYLVQHADTSAAAAVYKQGIKSGAAADELYYSHSTALYHAQYDLERALTLCDEAIAANPLPLYTQHRAMVLYSLKRYGEAAEGFEAVAQTDMRSAQVYVYAYQSHRMANDSLNVCLAMLDSAMTCYMKPYPVEAATTLLLRASTRAEMKMWRAAVADYNEYEHLCAGHVNTEFYYNRFIAEANGRMYQQALDDLDRALALSPDEAELHAQKALLLYRLGHVEEALPIARRAIEIDESWAEELKEIISSDSL